MVAKCICCYGNRDVSFFFGCNLELLETGGCFSDYPLYSKSTYKQSICSRKVNNFKSFTIQSLVNKVIYI